MKKTVSLLIVLMLALTAFAGCSGGNAPTAPASSTAPAGSTAPASSEAAPSEAPATDEPITVSLLIDNQSTLDGLNAVIAAIKEKHNIITEIELRPGGDEGDNVVKTRLATGEMADICWYNSGSLFMALGPDAYFLDLTNEPFMANIDDGFKPAVTVDGKVYAIPTGAGMGGAWLYNKKVYAELGLSVPTTWEELMSNCQKIKEAGKVPVISSYKDSWTAQLIFLADFYNVYRKYPTFAQDLTENKVKFADNEMTVRSFEKMAEVHKRGFMNDDFMATTYDDAILMLANGDGAHYPMLTFALSAINSMYPEQAQDIGLFGQPGDDANDHGLTVWSAAGISFNKNSKNKDALLTWAGFYASSEAMNIQMSAQLPDGPMSIKGVTLPDSVLPAVKDMQPYADDGKTAPALEFLSPIKGPNLPQICVEAGSEIKSPQECAASYDNDVEKQAKQLGLAGW